MNAVSSLDPVILQLNTSAHLRAAIETAREADRRRLPAVVVIDTTGSDDVDPFVAAAAVAQATDRIPFVVVVPTAQWQPYPIARRLAEIDKLSAGRVRWNPIDADPDRAAEAVKVVSALLISWRPGALLNERSTGRHADSTRIVPVAVTGRYFTIDSPLDVPPGPQGVVPVVDVGVQSWEPAR